MNIQIEDIGPCRKSVRVEVPAEQVNATYEEVLGEFAREAKIPGFRPGRAPREVVGKRFAQDIQKEVKDRLVPEGYREAVKQHNLHVIEVLAVDDVSYVAGAPMVFKLTLDVSPDFTLPVYKEIPLQKKKQEVTAAAVDEVVKDILDRAATWEEVAGRPVQAGDLAMTDYEGVADGKPVAELAPKMEMLGKVTDQLIPAQPESIIPGLGAALVGMSAGERKQLAVDFPADYFEKALAGRKADYFITVKGVREKKLPAMDAEFFKKMGMESEAALRDQIRKDLAAAQGQQEHARLRGEIVKYLIEKTTLDLPASVVERETRDAVYDIVSTHRARGVPQETIEEKKEEVFQAAARTAQDRVKLRYILHRIAEQEKVEATEEDLAGRLAELARRYRSTPEEVRAELEKKDSLDDIRFEVRLNKVLDFLLAQAKVKEE
ncbi:MAG TPA: trigger factor [Kiritimatiellia bacterium]|nr:trigger factor [Kiritimatiellia bacterium]HRZ10950.1 trigger factor [Kiritimatiellia bacterium]HSA18523.1 trigger factor [Kiritimatiellia bacterium]